MQCRVKPGRIKTSLKYTGANVTTDTHYDPNALLEKLWKSFSLLISKGTRMLDQTCLLDGQTASATPPRQIHDFGIGESNHFFNRPKSTIWHLTHQVIVNEKVSRVWNSLSRSCFSLFTELFQAQHFECLPGEIVWKRALWKAVTGTTKTHFYFIRKVHEVSFLASASHSYSSKHPQQELWNTPSYLQTESAGRLPLTSNCRQECFSSFQSQTGIWHSKH